MESITDKVEKSQKEKVIKHLKNLINLIENDCFMFPEIACTANKTASGAFYHFVSFRGGADLPLIGKIKGE